MTATDTTRAGVLEALEAELGTLVRRIRRVIRERAREVHEDLAPPAYLMLMYLHGEGARRSSEVVCEFGIDKGAVSRQVQHLVDLGLLARLPDPDDRRATLLEVTATGARRLDEVAAHRRTHLDERLAGWTDTELRDLVTGLGRYNAALE